MLVTYLHTIVNIFIQFWENLSHRRFPVVGRKSYFITLIVKLIDREKHGLHLAMEVFDFVYVKNFSSIFIGTLWAEVASLSSSPVGFRSTQSSSKPLTWLYWAISPLSWALGKLWTLLAAFVPCLNILELLSDLDRGCFAGGYIFHGQCGICPTKKVLYSARCSSGICYSCSSQPPVAMKCIFFWHINIQMCSHIRRHFSILPSDDYQFPKNHLHIPR